MDLATCLKKMELVGVLAFATVDSDVRRRSEISVLFIMSRMLYISLPQGERIFVKNCWRMAEFRYYVIQNIKK